MKGRLLSHGFTIVELLIVIVVIAILAAISIVAYNGIQERARITTAKSDLANIAKKIELFNAEYGEYPDTLTDVKSLGLTTSIDNGGIALYCGDVTGYVVIINEKTAGAGRQFKIGKGIELQEIAPALGWSHATLCGSTPYPSMAWNAYW